MNRCAKGNTGYSPKTIMVVATNVHDRKKSNLAHLGGLREMVDKEEKDLGRNYP